jgi:DTW domain-containing protein YfiP
MAHFMEDYRPSSTGHLINRVIPSAGRFIYRKERSLDRATIAPPDRELWILHPDGEPLAVNSGSDRIQVMLLDGTWSQVARMAQVVSGWGRKVRLPLAGASRYWLRAQGHAGRFSTVEALLSLLGALGFSREQAELRLQFELHVFAHLCARGQKQLAAEYLAGSPLAGAFPELIARLTHSNRDSQ